MLFSEAQRTTTSATLVAVFSSQRLQQRIKQHVDKALSILVTRGCLLWNNRDHVVWDPVLHNESIFRWQVNQDRNAETIFVTSYLQNFFFLAVLARALSWILTSKLLSPMLFFKIPSTFFSCPTSVYQWEKMMGWQLVANRHTDHPGTQASELLLEQVSIMMMLVTLNMLLLVLRSWRLNNKY